MPDSAYHCKIMKRNQLVLDELLSVYCAHPALRGIYISNEPDRDNVETFHFPQRGEPLTPAPLERIDRQYEAGKPFVERTITWEYGHFLGRQLVGEERYRAFREWNVGKGVDIE